MSSEGSEVGPGEGVEEGSGTPATLYDYYTSKGQVLPKISERGKIFEQLGLGLANQYKGTAAQNTLLLEKLLQADLSETSSVKAIGYDGGVLSLPLNSSDADSIRSLYEQFWKDISGIGMDWETAANTVISVANNPDYWNLPEFQPFFQILETMLNFGEADIQAQYEQQVQKELYAPSELKWENNDSTFEQDGDFTSPSYHYDDNTDQWIIADTIPEELANINPTDVGFYVGQGRDMIFEQVSSQATETVIEEFIEPNIPESTFSLLNRFEEGLNLYQIFKNFFEDTFNFISDGMDAVSENREWDDSAAWDRAKTFQHELVEYEISRTSGIGGILSDSISHVRTIILHSDLQFSIEDTSLIPEYQTPVGHRVGILGAASGDNLVGGDGDDVLVGQDGKDKIVGGAGNDYIQGGGGDDRLYNGKGNDQFDGGLGNDTVYLTGNYADYTISAGTDGHFTITDNVYNRDGIDDVLGIEYFNFADTVIASNAILPPTPDLSDQVLQQKLFLTFDSKSGYTYYGGNNIDELSFSKSGYSYGGSKQTGDGGWSIQLPGNPPIFTSVHDIERLEFGDGTKVALDVISPTQSAGAAVALWYAYYDQLPGGFDLGGWIAKADQIHDSPVFDQNDLEELAQSMLTSFTSSSNSGSKDGSGSKNSGISNTDLVTRLYTNIVGTAPSSDDLNYFTQLIETGAYTQAGLFAYAAAHELNTEQYADLMGSGLQYVSKEG